MAYRSRTSQCYVKATFARFSYSGGHWSPPFAAPSTELTKLRTVVDRLMTQLPAAKAVGALVDDRTCRVGLRIRELPWNDSHGKLVTMTTDAAVELLPSLLLGWSYCWRKREKALRGVPIPSEELPAPPAQLDLVEDGRTYRVRLEECERTEWPDLPCRQSDDAWND